MLICRLQGGTVEGLLTGRIIASGKLPLSTCYSCMLHSEPPSSLFCLAYAPFISLVDSLYPVTSAPVHRLFNRPPPSSSEEDEGEVDMFTQSTMPGVPDNAYDVAPKSTSISGTVRTKTHIENQQTTSDSSGKVKASRETGSDLLEELGQQFKHPNEAGHASLTHHSSDATAEDRVLPLVQRCNSVTSMKISTSAKQSVEFPTMSSSPLIELPGRTPPPEEWQRFRAIKKTVDSWGGGGNLGERLPLSSLESGLRSFASTISRPPHQISHVILKSFLSGRTLRTSE